MQGHSGIKNHLILLGVFFSILYWILQSLVKSGIFYEGTFWGQLFTRDTNELWLRCLVVFILIMFTTFVQYIFRRLEIAEKALQKSREEFVTMLTHDLKTPLTAMLNNAQLIADRRCGEIPEEKMRFAKEISESGAIMLHMINNMMNASRISSGQMEYSFESFSLEELLNELRRTFESQVRTSGISLELTCSPGVSVNGDRSKLRQVFYNLLSNAFRYTPKGGRIYVNALEDGKCVNIVVGDTGRGIPASEQGKIFRKFGQVTGERQGTGLGLYIVQSFLKGHGSEISLKSAEGQGTQFSFSLQKARG